MTRPTRRMRRMDFALAVIVAVALVAAGVGGFEYRRRQIIARAVNALAGMGCSVLIRDGGEYEVWLGDALNAAPSGDRLVRELGALPGVVLRLDARDIERGDIPKLDHLANASAIMIYQRAGYLGELATLSDLPALELIAIGDNPVWPETLGDLSRFPALRYVLLTDESVDGATFDKLRVSYPHIVFAGDDGGADAGASKPLSPDDERSLRLADGGEVKWSYNAIADSGAQVKRVDRTGAVVWRVDCEPLGVEHSRYRHTVEVLIRGDVVHVVSHASGGIWIEQRRLDDGSLVRRADY